jgi:hypothetical protein
MPTNIKWYATKRSSTRLLAVALLFISAKSLFLHNVHQVQRWTLAGGAGDPYNAEVEVGRDFALFTLEVDWRL